MVVSGANGGIEAEGLGDRWADRWAASVLLLHNEVPEEVNLAAAQATRARRARVVFNAAPARLASEEMLALVDLLVVNRVEARMLTGEDGEGALRHLHDPRRDAVLTQGAEGPMTIGRDGTVSHVPAIPVTARSSHGAGDMFCGALGARLAAGDDLSAACAFAARAAGLHVSLTEAERAALTYEQVAP